jgi:hypothetical protein
MFKDESIVDRLADSAILCNAKRETVTELHKALGDIDSIRKQMAATTQFRGYGPATLAATSILAITAAAVQAKLLTDAPINISTYLSIWILTAAIAATLSGVQMYTRARRVHSGLSQEMIHMAVEQFVPPMLAGTFITIVLVRYASSVVWMLPGLWQVIFSLGIFASCRFLPRAMVAPATWYLLTGLACLSIGDERALSPWTMGAAFGIGQMMIAAVLYFNSQEGTDGE